MRGLLAFTLLLAACSGPATPPEQAIREWVAAATVAAEAKERRTLMAMVSPAYSDARGNEQSDIENVLRAYFFRVHSIELVTKIDSIRLYGDSAADVEVTVGMAGRNDGVFGFSADAYQFELELELSGDDWQLLSARWGELGHDLN